MTKHIISGYILLALAALAILCVIIFHLAHPVVCLALVFILSAASIGMHALDLATKLTDGKDNK